MPHLLSIISDLKYVKLFFILSIMNFMHASYIFPNSSQIETDIMNSKTNLLLKPFSLKSLHLPNRIVMAPMTRSQSKNNIPDKAVARYYRKRAEGGVGLIITEGTSINHKAAHANLNVPNFYGKEALEGWKFVVEEVHKAGGCIVPQLWHTGSVRQTSIEEGLSGSPITPGYGPSPIPHPYITNAEVPHEMSEEDIQNVIAAFVQAAKDAKALGFDGVEIHGAHGYLIDQFFWSYTNKRTDRYGGKTLAQRTQFAVELIQEIRKAVGEDFAIIFRFSQWKLGDYKAKLAATPSELNSFLTPLSKAGVDIFHCSTRSFDEPEFIDSSLNLAGWTKKLTGKPTITVGSVGLDSDFISTLKQSSPSHSSKKSFDSLLMRLENEEFDLVAVGRALIGDPNWVKKVTSNHFSSIIPFSKEQLQSLD